MQVAFVNKSLLHNMLMASSFIFYCTSMLRTKDPVNAPMMGHDRLPRHRHRKSSG